jgi:hypothetical protein
MLFYLIFDGLNAWRAIGSKFFGAGKSNHPSLHFLSLHSKSFKVLYLHFWYILLLL